ncbi:MAG: primosomal protein N' [Gammaproteobacteria bacterium]|nr:primosomal protein N' [Gammaproteobacteria bacterium]
MTAGRILRVAIGAPLSRLFDYRSPRGPVPAPGCRVSVPFGRRTETGLVMDTATRSDVPADKLRDAKAVLDSEPLLREDDLWLIHFVSDYYHHPIGEVAAAALPALLRQGKPLAPARTFLSITTAGAGADLDVLRKRAPKQAALLEAVCDHDTVSFDALDDELPGWRRARKALVDKGFLESFESADDGALDQELANVEQVPGPMLNPDQRAALAAMRAGDGFRVSLLDGVTGSGKTEVYLHLIKEQIDAGRQVLVLVPEIGLTPQLVRRFSTRLGLEPVLLHSALTDTARLAAWRAARNGSARLIVGTRSAIFVPLANPGMIIVDEEHDNSLKQQEGLRYSARDLAVARGKRLGIPVVLGSATPSLESLRRCSEGAYTAVRLPVRAGRAVPPLMRLVDLTRFDAFDGLSQPVIAAIDKNLAAGGQVLVFLNRRGFAPTLICPGCGRIAECAYCDSRMTVHAASGLLKCHHCGAQRRTETDCPDCGSGLRPLGHGTERLEDALRNRFPGQLITRIDSDSMRLKGTMTKALAMATTGEARILVGTQMLSKGHHFPNLTLVVVINADQGLFSTDFRGGEKLAQSLVQVAGRAGRKERQGEVIIQTAFPGHPFWGELLSRGYHGVAETVLAERERTLWPPFSRLALVCASAKTRADAHDFLAAARHAAESAAVPGVRILGPVAAPMERKAGRYRAQLLLQSTSRASLHQLLGCLRESLEAGAGTRRLRWSVDVDPIELF